MNNTDFFVLLLDNVGKYLFCLLITILLSLLFLRKIYVSIIDPLTITIIFSIIANTVPVFLYLTGEISSCYFVYFLLSETLFWSGFIIGRGAPKIRSCGIIIDKYGMSRLVYFAFFFLLFSLTILTYILFGIPAFMDRRMDVFAGSGGFGIIARLSPFLTVFCVFYSYYVFDTTRDFKMRLFSAFVLVCIGLFGILSGSRSSIMIFAFAYYGYCFFYRNELPKKKIIRSVIVIGGIGALYMFSFSAIGEGLFGATISFLIRLVANGDAYWSAYPNAMLEQVQPAPWYIDLFAGFIFPLRLADITSYPASIGQQLTWLNNPILDGANIGANSRPTIFGYVHFGWFGCLFSLLLGAFISSAIKIIPLLCPKGIIGAIIAFYSYNQLLALVVDPPIGVMFLFDEMLSLAFLFITIIVIGLILNFFKYALAKQ